MTDKLKELVAQIRDTYPKFIAFTDIPHMAYEAGDAIEALIKRAENAEAERDAAYAAGQRDMREAAANKAEAARSTADGADIADTINALPIGESHEKS